MEIQHINKGTINKNCISIMLNGFEIDLYFSYQTLIAVNLNGILKCSINEWGTPTGKYLNEIQPDKDKDKRISQQEVLDFAVKSFQELGIKIKETILKEL